MPNLGIVCWNMDGKIIMPHHLVRCPCFGDWCNLRAQFYGIFHFLFCFVLFLVFPIALLFVAVKAMNSWLRSEEGNVAVVHCKVDCLDSSMICFS